MEKVGASKPSLPVGARELKRFSRFLFRSTQREIQSTEDRAASARPALSHCNSSCALVRSRLPSSGCRARNRRTKNPSHNRRLHHFPLRRRRQIRILVGRAWKSVHVASATLRRGLCAILLSFEGRGVGIRLPGPDIHSIGGASSGPIGRCACKRIQNGLANGFANSETRDAGQQN